MADTSFNKAGSNYHTVTTTLDGDVDIKGECALKIADAQVPIVYALSRFEDPGRWARLGRKHFEATDAGHKNPWTVRAFLDAGKVLYFQQKGFAMNYLIGDDPGQDESDV